MLEKDDRRLFYVNGTTISGFAAMFRFGAHGGLFKAMELSASVVI